MAKLAVRLILLLSLVGLITYAPPALATPDEVEWSQVDIPTEGKPGNWMLASGSDVKHLSMASDGTLYGYANPSGTDYTLFKSTDDGYSWSYTGMVKDEIVSIATAPDGESTVYYASSSDVYKSTDGGESFIELPLSPGGAGSNNVEITAIDVAQLDSDNTIAVGTRDTDNSEYGGVYILDEGESFPNWVNTNIGNYDVYTVAFSPSFADDAMLMAVVTDQAHTYVSYNYGGIGDWTMIELLDDSNASFAITNASNIGLPSDFNGTLFVGIVGGDGGIYEVDEDHSKRLSNINTDIISLDVAQDSGTIKLLAGESSNAMVWYSDDDGDSWDSAVKAPSGSGPTYVVMADDFTDSGKAYAATSGSDSAVSYTTDSGVTWNQIGLIDTAINIIIDLALSTSYSQDTPLFMLTWGGEHGLWRSLSSIGGWERVFSSTMPNVDSLSQVSLSPQYGDDKEVVFLAGTSNGSPIIWKSSDNGQTFRSRRSAPSSIDTWAIVNNTTFFLGSYDGSSGLVYLTTNSGLGYSTEVEVGSEPLNSMVLSPSYEQDETILVGNTNGWVYWSSDNGASFDPLPPDAVSPPLTGSVSVAFDPEFSSNRTIYAASDTADAGIYRFTIDTSTKWENIDSPTGGMLRQLVVSGDGTLYATNSKIDGGMERCLNPTYSLGPTFETVTRGLDDGATLTKLWLWDNRLWSVDTTNVKLMTFTDSLTLPVILTSPPIQAQGVGTVTNNTVSDVRLDWETLSGASNYKWQLNDDTDFSNVPASFEDETKASSTRLPDLEPATTYYWRVRATKPVLSPWSDKWSFTTSMGGEATGPQLISPEAGASGVSINPVFQWSAIAGADSYELIVSTDAALSSPVILKVDDYALPATAWQCNINLDYDTTYYWKVRGVSAETHSAWSGVGAFTTMVEPVEPAQEPPPLPEAPSTSPEGPPPSPEQPPPSPTTPDWVKYVISGLLTAVILLSVIVVMLMRGMRRL